MSKIAQGTDRFVTEQQAYEKRWVMLGVLITSVMVVSIDNTILNVALPTIQLNLHATQGQQAWIVDAYLLVFAGLLLTLGSLGDRIGRRKVLSFGIGIFGFGSLISVFATNANELIATRALMGVGAAAIMPATLAIITRVFEPHERGKAIGLWAGVLGLSVGIGPLVGGVLLEHYWWGSVFLVNVPVVVIALLVIPFLVPESKAVVAAKSDPIGVLLSVTGLSVFIYGVIKGGELATLMDAHVIAPLLAGAVILAQFVIYELRRPEPMIDFKIFKIRAFSAASLAISLIFFALMGATFFLTFYLQFVRGMSPLATGAMLLPMAAGMVIFAPRSAGLVARFGTRWVSFSGMMLVGVSFLTYQVIGVDTSMVALGVLLFAMGTGMGTGMAPATTAIMNALPLDRAGAGSAINNTTRQVGGALGVAILGSVLAGTYRSFVAPALASLPSAVRERAGESIGATLAAAHAAGPAGASIVGPAKHAFVDAFHVASLGSAGMAFLGALVVLKWFPTAVAHRARETSPALPTQRVNADAYALESDGAPTLHLLAEI